MTSSTHRTAGRDSASRQRWPLDAFATMRAIRDHATLTSTERHALHVAVLRADGTTGKVRATIAQLAADAGMSREAMGRILKRPHVAAWFCHVQRSRRTIELWLPPTPTVTQGHAPADSDTDGGSPSSVTEDHTERDAGSHHLPASTDLPTPQPPGTTPPLVATGAGQDDHIEAVRRAHGNVHDREAVEAAGQRLRSDSSVRDVGALLRSPAGRRHLDEAQASRNRAAAHRRHSEQVATEHRAAAAQRRNANTRWTFTRSVTRATIPNPLEVTWLALAAAADGDADAFRRLAALSGTGGPTVAYDHHEPAQQEATA